VYPLTQSLNSSAFDANKQASVGLSTQPYAIDTTAPTLSLKQPILLWLVENEKQNLLKCYQCSTCICYL